MIVCESYMIPFETSLEENCLSEGNDGGARTHVHVTDSYKGSMNYDVLVINVER